MRRLIIFLIILQLGIGVACTPYQSSGRKLIEKNTNNIVVASGVEVTTDSTYSCSRSNSSILSAIGDKVEVMFDPTIKRSGRFWLRKSELVKGSQFEYPPYFMATSGSYFCEYSSKQGGYSVEQWSQVTEQAEYILNNLVEANL